MKVTCDPEVDVLSILLSLEFLHLLRGIVG